MAGVVAAIATRRLAHPKVAIIPDWWNYAEGESIMRTVVCVATFVILLLIGFLATPGLFKIVNPEYLLALREYGPALAELTQDVSEIEKQLADLQSKTSALERSLKDLSNTAMAKQAAMKAANVEVTEITAYTIDLASKANALGIERDQIAGQMKLLDEQKASIEASRTDLRKKLDAAAADSVNIYLVARALALGAIGALMSIFAKYLSIPTTHSLFDDDASMGRMWASIAMGGIVSVVVIGLFFTGFISIFANAAQNTETDFWKVTILCLLAGAFSDRLFQAAAGKMESYLRTVGTGKARAVASRPGRKKTTQAKLPQG
jgi:hypothetical protein